MKKNRITKKRIAEALNVDDLLKMHKDKKDAEIASLAAKQSQEKPKITSIWIKKLNINRNHPMNDTADIEITWSDGKVEDTSFNIGTSGKILGAEEWDDPDEIGEDPDIIDYRREVGDGGYVQKDEYLQMDKLYRDIVKTLKENVKYQRKFDHTEYPERHDINGSLMPTKKGSPHDNQLYKGRGVFKGGKTLKNTYQKAKAIITDEDVRVCMVKFGFDFQPGIKWYYGKDKYEDPVWAFSRVKPDPALQKIAMHKIESDFKRDSTYKGREIFKSGNTTIYKK